MLATKGKNASGTSGLGFNFDVVVTFINLTNAKYEDFSKLNINVQFNEHLFKVTSSRINVNVFNPERSLDFTDRPSALRDKLFKNPLVCDVFSSGQLVGSAQFIWPESFINCIAAGCGRELIQCDEAEIIFNEKPVGKMEILARLQIKCGEFQEVPSLPQPKINLCNNDDALNANDIMFVVGETKNDISGCPDVEVIRGTESASSACATHLDLSEFRHVHGKTVTDTAIIDSINANCCKEKQSGNQYNLGGKSRASATCSAYKPKQDIFSSPCEQQMNALDGISESRIASCSSTDSYQPSRCISDENGAEDKSMSCQGDGLIEKPAKRYCPLCHDNITWLPKFAACPKCGFKSFHHEIQEKPYDYTLTANKILQDFAKFSPDGDGMKEASNISLTNSQQIGSCRCTCKGDKMCAHCRIRKLCEDIFQPSHKANEDCGKCQNKSSKIFNICKTSGPDCRPYLSKVFQELKELFDINETKKLDLAASNELKKTPKNSEDKSSPNLKENQSQEVNKSRKERSSKSVTSEKALDAERKKFSVKNFRKFESCKNKSFEYNKKRQYPGTKIGHQTCFEGQKIVPRNMGWLWNAENNGFRTGWMPGAIRKPIKLLMQHFLKTNAIHPCCDWQIKKEFGKEDHEEKYYSKEPTLHVCKKNGVYYVTLRPLKDFGAIRDCSDHNVNMKPIQFKIIKAPFLTEMRKLKQFLKDLGYAKCRCHRPISLCCCRNFLEKKKLAYHCSKECQKREIPNCVENLILSDTSDSEAEFEFGVTPPAGETRTDKCIKKRRKVSSGTQYVQGDWNIKLEYEKPLVKYLKLRNCAIGNRFGKAFDPYGEDGYGPGVEPSEIPYGLCGGRPKKGRSGQETAGAMGTEAFKGQDGKFNMAQYLRYKALFKPSPEEIAERKRQKMALLRGVNPPLLCKVDRRGKPIEYYSPSNAICDERIC